MSEEDGLFYYGLVIASIIIVLIILYVFGVIK